MAKNGSIPSRNKKRRSNVCDRQTDRQTDGQMDRQSREKNNRLLGKARRSTQPRIKCRPIGPDDRRYAAVIVQLQTLIYFIELFFL